jgi:hypothetical protein
MTGLIELKLSGLNQLFNSMDPSPFHERDLDHDAEEFIVSWAALVVGLVFLGLCQLGASALIDTGGWRSFVREGLLIVGWVAMWKPLDIALYRWWPLVAQGRLYRRLARMPVEVMVGP